MKCPYVDWGWRVEQTLESNNPFEQKFRAPTSGSRSRMCRIQRGNAFGLGGCRQPRSRTLTSFRAFFNFYIHVIQISITHFFKTTTLYPGGIRSRDPYVAPISSVADGDGSTRPRRQGISITHLCLQNNSFATYPFFLFLWNQSYNHSQYICIYRRWYKSGYLQSTKNCLWKYICNFLQR
jgi:hypothetical protein